MFAIRDAVIEPRQRPALSRAVALQDQDRLVHKPVTGPVGLMQVIKERLDLGRHQDLPVRASLPSP
jgi:hypothetical protein